MKILVALGSFTVLTGCASPPTPAAPPSAAPAPGTAVQSASHESGSAVTPQTREQRAATTLQRIEARDFTGSREWFDDAMRTQLGEEAIRDVWTQTESKFGAFRSQSFNGATRVNGYIALDFDLTFDRGHVKGRVVFDDAAKVAGLLFRPLE